MLIINQKPQLKPKLILLDENHQYKGFISLFEKENQIDHLKDDIKYFYIKYNKKKTETIIRSDNIEILEFSYNKRRKCFDVSLNSHKEYGTINNEIDNSTCFKYRKNKKITYYFSKDFKNEDVHLFISFDSQNIFTIKNVGPYTRKNDPYKGWQIEVPMAISGKNFIVMGMENADKYRTNELTPKADNNMVRVKEDKDLFNGRLDILGEFIKDKIYEIANEFNIKDVSIMGSSMGGMASFYLGLKYPEIYDYIYTFSPANGLLKDSFWKKFYQNIEINQNQKMYLFFGGNDNLERALKDMAKNLTKDLFKAGFNQNNIYTYYDNSLKHNEISWRYAFNYFFNICMKNEK